MKTLLVFGTRPEAIKMCPLVLELKKHNGIETEVCLTGQHREMLEQVMSAFGIEADYNLDIMKESQTLTSITTGVLQGMEAVLDSSKPDIVLVHGDTTTSYAAALAAFYRKIPVGHVEAGLRTGDIYSPFPEEMNRLLTDRISTFYFAPTEVNLKNLNREGITDNIYVTGNTVIDSFQYTVKSDYMFHSHALADVTMNNKRIILVTAHRRENLGRPLECICDAVKRLASDHKDDLYIYPVHYNPLVRTTVNSILSGISNVLLIDPIDVIDMHNLISRCYLVLTDSGGLQEEAPHFGKPVLVMRTETERPEAVEAGTARVVGTDSDKIYDAATQLLEDRDAYNRMAQAVNPYGDGHACSRIVSALNAAAEKGYL